MTLETEHLENVAFLKREYGTNVVVAQIESQYAAAVERFASHGDKIPELAREYVAAWCRQNPSPRREIPADPDDGIFGAPYSSITLPPRS